MLRYLLALGLSSFLPLSAIEVWTVPGSANLKQPFSLDFDAHGQLYGVEFQPTNQVFTVSEGKFNYISGVKWNSETKGAKPPAPSNPKDLNPAVYNALHDVTCLPDGTIILSDTFQHRLCRLDPKTHQTTLLAGTGNPGFKGDGGPATEAQFNNPFCAALSPDQKSFYIADLGNARIRRLQLATGVIETVAGNGKRGIPAANSVATEAPLPGPRACCMAADGTLYIILREGHALAAVKNDKVNIVVNLSGQKGLAGDQGPALQAQLNGPKYVCMTPKGLVLILDTENHALRVYDPQNHTLKTLVGTLGKAGNHVGPDWASTQLRRPHGARIGPDGKLYVVDTENDRILVGPAP
jgi:sugar lactone lactonase YvrE